MNLNCFVFFIIYYYYDDLVYYMHMDDLLFMIVCFSFLGTYLHFLVTGCKIAPNITNLLMNLPIYMMRSTYNHFK